RGNRSHIRGRHHDILGDRTRMVLAENAEAQAQRLLAIAAVRARPIANARIDHHAIADRDLSHALSDRVDDASAIGSENPWRRDGDTGHSTDDEEIEVIERR